MVVAVIWAWRCGSSARYGAHASADRRTDASTTSAARDRADYRPSAGADQTAAHRAIGGIVRVRDGCGRQHKSSADHAGYGRLLCHSLSTEKLREWGRLLDQLAIEVQLNSPCNGTNKWHGVAVPVPAAPARLPHPLPLTGQLGVAQTAAASLTSRCSASARPPASEINAAVSAISPASGRRRRLRRLRPQGIERLRGRFPAQRRSQWRLPDLSCGPRLPPWQRRWSCSPSPRP